MVTEIYICYDAFIPCGRLSVIMLAVFGPNDYINYTLNVHTYVQVAYA